jgi:deazaflavin-dependent oxidoreductase (nitroreductase family)
MSELVTFDRRALMQAIARFNRRYTNPFTLSFAGRPHSPFAMVRHLGRTSGRPYTTPVVAIRTADGFIIPLTYGPNTDWHLNVRAAGEAVIASQGQAYRITRPEVIDARVGSAALSPILARILESAHVENHLRVTRDPAAPLSQTAYNRLISDYPITRAVRVLGAATALVAAIVLLARALMRRG